MRRRWHSMGMSTWWRPHANGVDAWFAILMADGWHLEKIHGAQDGPPFVGGRTRWGRVRLLVNAKTMAEQAEL